MERQTAETNAWLTAISDFSAQLRARLATRLEYKDLLGSLLNHPECPILKLDVRVSGLPEAPISLRLEAGGPAQTPPTDRWTLELASTTWVVEAWRSSISGNTQTFDREQVREILDCFWKTTAHDEKSRLISLQYPTTQAIVNNYLRTISERGDPVACFYVDLDHFKEVNDKLGHDAGDRVILCWSRMAEQLLGEEGVVLHRSGDEFLLFYAGATPTSAVGVATQLMKATSETDFDVSDIKVGCSVGISLSGPGLFPVYDELATEAERAVMSSGEKRRGRVSLLESSGPGFEAVDEQESDLTTGIRRAICIIRTELASRDVFASPWLNNIARIVRLTMENAANVGLIQEAVENALFWFPAPEATPFVASRLALERVYRVPASVISRVDVALAVARGVFASTLEGPAGADGISLQLRYTTCGSAVELRDRTLDRTIWQSDASASVTGDWVSQDLGLCIGLGSKTRGDSTHTRRACLIKIGHDRLSLLTASMFAEVLTVDDRPTRGGQLPDFWEATVARLIALLAAEPALEFCYILGDRRYAQETIGRLEAAVHWRRDLELMSYKTGRLPSEVADASDRIREIRIFSNERDLLAVLADDLLSGPVLAPPASPSTPRQSRRFLVRRLENQVFSLNAHDGIRVDTIAEAFPVVLEMARKAEREGVILDAAGQELRELVDFKVVLRTPQVDRIPAFYRSESVSLDAYLHRAFLDKESLFGAELARDGQLDFVLGHLAEVISSGTKFATRRAILVVPHQIVPGEDLSPLGLVSVRLIPRFVGETIRILYSFTWRTVEAFVGFPYSLYGSVGFAEYLTSELQARVATERGRHVGMGGVSYIAHSLHMFVDAYGQNIARRIVDDASK